MFLTHVVLTLSAMYHLGGQYVLVFLDTGAIHSRTVNEENVKITVTVLHREPAGITIV